MIRLSPLLAVVLVFVFVLAAPPLRAQAKALPPAIAAQQELAQVRNELGELKAIAGVVADKQLRARLEQSITRLEGRVNKLQLVVATLPVAPRTAVAPDVASATATATASAAKHEALMAAMQEQGFDDNRLKVLQEFLAKDALSCAQAAQVVQQFKFSDGQVQAAIAVHPRLSDPANFEQVLGALTFGLDKDKVRKALKLK